MNYYLMPKGDKWVITHYRKELVILKDRYQGERIIKNIMKRVK